MADSEDSVASGDEPKQTVKKAPSAKKKSASTKKVVAKKGVAKKKAVKKKVAKAEAAPAPAPVSAPESPAPIWDDDEGAPSLLSHVINVAPIVLLVLLMLILSSTDDADIESAAPATESQSSQAAPASSNANVVSAELIEAIASGAIELPENFDPWAFQQGADGAVDPAWSLDNLQQLEQDPGAFFWGAPTLDEAPPAPDAQ